MSNTKKQATWTPLDEIVCLQQQVEHLQAKGEGAFKAGFLAGTREGVRAVIEGTCQTMRRTAEKWGDCPPSVVIGFADDMERELSRVLAAICDDAVKIMGGAHGR